MVSFFQDYAEKFARTPDGRYSFSASKKDIEKYFSARVKEEISNRLPAFDVTSPAYTFIIGGCHPSENIMLECGRGRFPDRLSRFVSSDRCQKYVLREKDILIDVAEFNVIFDGIFNSAFRRGFACGHRNAFALAHRRLDSYSMFKVMKYLYGGTNCVNVWKEGGGGPPRCIVSVNGLIDKYVNNKAEMNKSGEFKRIVSEVRQYADERIGISS